MTMANGEEKFKIVEVTMTVQYMVPMHNDTITKINGWTLEEVINDWFLRRGCNGYHATRNSFEIGNSKEIVDVKVKEPQ